MYVDSPWNRLRTSYPIWEAIALSFLNLTQACKRDMLILTNWPTSCQILGKKR